MAETVTTTPTVQAGTEVLMAYDTIRSKYIYASKMAESGGASFNPGSFLGQPGFYRSVDTGGLTERTGGLDKLFYTLIMGVVEDPDYAYQKDRKIYARMLRDPQIYYCLEVRKAATTSLPWTVVPPTGQEQNMTAKLLAQNVERRLQQIPRMTELLDNIMEALLPGISINELIWQVNSQGEYVINGHYPMNKDRFKFEKDGRLRMLSPKSALVGIPVAPYKFIKHVFNLSDGSWNEPNTIGYSYYGKGLADTPLYHYFHFKIAALKYLMQSMERTGFPARMLYTGGQNTALANKLSSIMTAIKNDAVVAIPGKDGEVKVEQMRITANHQLFMTFMEYVDRLITRAILGQDLMTETGETGSYSLGQVHQDVFQMIRNKDKHHLEDTLTRTLVAYDCMLNSPNVPKELWPEFKFKQSALSDAAPFVELVNAATNLGIDTSLSQFRELTGLKAPNEMGDGSNEDSLLAHQQQKQVQQVQMQQALQPEQPEAGARAEKPTAKPPVQPKGKTNGKRTRK